MERIEMPLVSVITPVYNAALWLPETIASVQAQTLTDWEMILVDDGSTDGSVAIAEKAAAKDARIQVLCMPRNGGPILARNKGIAEAQGRFIAFLDADDLWLPEKLATQTAWMIEQHYEFTYHDYRYMSHDGQRTGSIISGPETLDMYSLHTRRGVLCSSVVLDTKSISGIRFPKINPTHAEDFCLWFSLIAQGHCGHRLACDLGRYRLLARSRSSNKFKAAINVWHLYREFSKLSLPRAAWWWMQYAWSAFWLHFHGWPKQEEERA